ncbi:MAG: chromosomal replication initiator protein DnaA [Porphyromonas sp.]|nr:chromosomal replication initiator protein DnaA [Porphyromonas sp.]
MNNHLQIAWGNFLTEVQTLLSSQKDYHLWFEPLRPIAMKENVLTIRVPSQDYYIKMEDVYLEIVKQGLEKAFGKGIVLQYQIPTESPTRSSACPAIKLEDGGVPQLDQAKPSVRSRTFDTHLDSRMRMDNFYQSYCNKLAYTAACTIIDKPGRNAFNPLFVHGASGVGKTHLLHAIGNALMERDPNYKAVYVPAQTFKRQFVEATIARKEPALFFNYYQNIDLLLIDDIQEFSEARSTQNAFFQIFNNLKLLGKQIIITSDRPPVELKGMEERLFTRLKWGLTAEIERPDVPLRRKILEKMVEDSEIELSEEVFNFVVKHAKDNVRDIEGSLTSLLAYSLYNDEKLDLSLAERVLSQTIGIEERKVSVPEILSTVCQYYNLDEEDVRGRRRKREIVQARQMVMYLAKKYTDVSLAAIGAEVGGRDHSTVIYSVSSLSDLIETDAKIAAEVAEIIELLDI